MEAIVQKSWKITVLEREKVASFLTVLGYLHQKLQEVEGGRVRRGLWRLFLLLHSSSMKTGPRRDLVRDRKQTSRLRPRVKLCP
jgi:hypothetical protein